MENKIKCSQCKKDYKINDISLGINVHFPDFNPTKSKI
jgi:hypothetical protein